MSEKKDGGPAYPSVTTRRIEGTVGPNGTFFPYIKSTGYATEIREVPEIHQGMTLRDYFAGQALAGILAGIKSPQDIRNNYHHSAEEAYGYADAMLAERDK